MSQRPDTDQTATGRPALRRGRVPVRDRTGRCSGGAWRNWPGPRSSAEPAASSTTRPQASWYEPAQPRDFLRFMAASLALARASPAAPSSRAEQIVPYVEQPEEFVPGKPLFFATALPLGRLRPRRAGREPHGPADQDRGEPRPPRQPRRDRPLRPGRDPRLSTTPTARQVVTQDGRVSTWDDFQECSCGLRERKLEAKGAGLASSPRPLTSPTLHRPGPPALARRSRRPKVARLRAGQRATPSEPARSWPSARNSSRSTTSIRPT